MSSSGSDTIWHNSAYESDTLELLRQALLQLRTFEQLTKELLQNADDAGATEFNLDFSGDGLLAHNNAELVSCPSAKEGSKRCEGNLIRPDRKYCDVHAIKRVASGNKRYDDATTGKFGIGFVSIYLITDRPEIRSKNVQLKFIPEEQYVSVATETSSISGTELWLPWAKDPESDFRRAVVKDVPNLDDLNSMVSQSIEACRESILFLRNIDRIQIKVEGEVALQISKVRSDFNSLVVLTDELNEEKQEWLSLKRHRGELEHLEKFQQSHNEFKTRRMEIELLIPQTQRNQDQGLLFATLATKSSSNLPLHINADFYPDQSRTSILFPDVADEPQSRWNAEIITAAAKILSEDLICIQKSFGNEAVWGILREAFSLHNRRANGVPECFKSFWKELKFASTNYEIVQTNSDEMVMPRDLICVPKNLGDSGKATARNLNIKFQSKVHDSDLAILLELGAGTLNQSIIGETLGDIKLFPNLFAESENLSWLEFWLPLFKTVDLLIEQDLNLAPELAKLSIWPTDGGSYVSHDSLISLSETDDYNICRVAFPGLDLIKQELQEFSQIMGTVPVLSGSNLLDHFDNAEHVKSFNISVTHIGGVLSFDFLMRYILTGNLSASAIDKWKNLPIWPMSDSQFGSLQFAFLPGGFTDPVGIGKLLDSEYLSSSACTNLVEYFHVREMTFREYVIGLLPKFHSESGFTSSIALSILKLVAHPPTAIESEMWRSLSGLSILRTDREYLSAPTECLANTPQMLKVFKKSPYHFVDPEQFVELGLGDSELNSFLNLLGVAIEPTHERIVETWRFIQNDPAFQEEDFSQLESLASELFSLASKSLIVSSMKKEVISGLRFPCSESCLGWHPPDEVFHARWQEALCEKENLHKLAIKIKKSDFRQASLILGIAEYPKLSEIISHLRHCVSDEVAIDPAVDELFEIYSKSSNEVDRQQIRSLRNEPCIFDESKNRYLVPREIYSEIPDHLNFLHGIAVVARAPSDRSSFWEILEIPNRLTVSELANFLPKIKKLIGSGEDVKANSHAYQKALSQIGISFTQGEQWARAIAEELAYDSILQTHNGDWISPIDGLLVDSPFWASLLADRLNHLLVTTDPEAVEFLKAAGLRTILETLTVHDDELVVEDIPEHQAITELIQKNHKSVAGVFSKIILDYSADGRSKATDAIPKLANLRSVRVAMSPLINVDVTIELDGSLERFEICNIPRLYVPRSNFAIFSNEDLPLLDTLESIIFHFLPEVPDGEWRGILSSLEGVLEQHLNPEETYSYLSKRSLVDDEMVWEEPEIKPDEVIEFRPLPSVSNEDMPDDSTRLINLSDSTEAVEMPEAVIVSRAVDSIASENSEIDLKSISEPTKTLPPLGVASRNRARDKSELESGQASLMTPQSNRVGAEVQNRIQQKAFSKNLQSHKRHSDRSNGGPGHLPSSNRGRAKSGYVYAEAEKPNPDGYLRNMSIEEAGIDYVLGLDWEMGRSIENVNESVANNKGYDLISRSETNPEDIRYIELKCLRGPWSDYGVGLTYSQFEYSQELGERYWLYVLEHATDADRARLHRIQDPWSHIRRIYFDEGWREIAQISPQQNPPPIRDGLMFVHPEKGVGKVTGEPWHQGHAVYCRVLFEGHASPVPVLWDDNFEVIGFVDDDNS